METSTRTHIQEIKFGMTKAEFQTLYNYIVNSPGDTVKISFGIYDDSKLSLSFSTLEKSGTRVLEHRIPQDVQPCPPYTGCPEEI